MQSTILSYEQCHSNHPLRLFFDKTTKNASWDRRKFDLLLQHRSTEGTKCISSEMAMHLRNWLYKCMFLVDPSDSKSACQRLRPSAEQQFCDQHNTMDLRARNNVSNTMVGTTPSGTNEVPDFLSASPHQTDYGGSVYDDDILVQERLRCEMWLEWWAVCVEIQRTESTERLVFRREVVEDAEKNTRNAIWAMQFHELFKLLVHTLDSTHWLRRQEIVRKEVVGRTTILLDELLDSRRLEIRTELVELESWSRQQIRLEELWLRQFKYRAVVVYSEDFERVTWEFGFNFELLFRQQRMEWDGLLLLVEKDKTSEDDSNATDTPPIITTTSSSSSSSSYPCSSPTPLSSSQCYDVDSLPRRHSLTSLSRSTTATPPFGVPPAIPPFGALSTTSFSIVTTTTTIRKNEDSTRSHAYNHLLPHASSPQQKPFLLLPNLDQKKTRDHIITSSSSSSADDIFSQFYSRFADLYNNIDPGSPQPTIPSCSIEYRRQSSQSNQAAPASSCSPPDYPPNKRIRLNATTTTLLQ